MIKPAAVLIGCVLFAASTQAAFAKTDAGAQASSRGVVTTHELVLRDGSRMYGTIEGENDVEVVFRTQAGALVTARRVDIASLEKITGGILNGEFLPSNANATRLFFAPTGRSLKKGQTSLGVYELIMPFVQYGVTDRFSVGGGTPLMFGIDESERPFWITPKLQVFETPTTQVAIGVLHGFSMNSDGGGIGYVVGTRGSGLGSVSIGGGLAYGSNGTESGVVMVGAERTVRRNLKLMTENYLWKDGNGVVSAGVRFFGQRLSADIGLGFPIGMGEFFGFPVVNLVYVF
jgi:hypothetical protein